jgi:hypothetical protein
MLPGGTVPNEEKPTLNERRKYLRLIRKRYLKASRIRRAHFLDQVVRRLAVGSDDEYEKEPHRWHLGEALYWVALLAPRLGPGVYHRP